MIEDIDWEAIYKDSRRSFDGTAPGSGEARSNWDAKAASFAHKPKRSDYIYQLMEWLDLAAEQTVFDMGCGSGTLAIPLAKAGHDVVAVDFSRGMLDELQRAAEAAGVADRIQAFQRSWQEDWNGLPACDVAVSSRSFVTDDLAEGIAKLEGQARERVVLTCGAGNLPYKDERILKALGRDEDAKMLPRELTTIVGYLLMSGRLPRLGYIEYPGSWMRRTQEELRETIRSTYKPYTEDEERIMCAYIDEHVVYDEERQHWALDYMRLDRWAVIDWRV